MSPEVAEKERRFLAFVAHMIGLHPEICFARVAHLGTLPREDQPFMAFLEVLVERPETAVLLVERLGGWREMMQSLQVFAQGPTMSVAQCFQDALDGDESKPALPFGRSGKGAYRKPTHRAEFGRALYKYLLKVNAYGNPLELVSDDWNVALARLGNHAIPTFGPLAQFNYLERLCLLGVLSPPDKYLESGGGPQRGFEEIYGDSGSMISDGTRMLRNLVDLTGNKCSLFALETFLCTMQKRRFRHCFRQLFEEPNLEKAVQEAVNCYLRALG